MQYLSSIIPHGYVFRYLHKSLSELSLFRPVVEDKNVVPGTTISPLPLVTKNPPVLATTVSIRPEEKETKKEDNALMTRETSGGRSPSS